MYNSVYKDIITRRKKIFHIIIIIFGTACGVISFTISSIELIKAFHPIQSNTVEDSASSSSSSNSTLLWLFDLLDYGVYSNNTFNIL